MAACGIASRVGEEQRAILSIFPQELLRGGGLSHLGGMLIAAWPWSAPQPVRAPQQAACLRQDPPKRPDL